MYISNSFTLGDPFIKLIDHPVTFPIVVELMGPHIQAGSAFTQVRRKDLDSRGFIHTDGGHALRNIRVTETSWPLQVKVFYFLTPLPETFMGNLACVPGSHYRPFPDVPSGVLPGAPETPGVVQVIGDAGDAVVFSHALWHGGTRNETDTWRKSVVYAYMQSFMRPWDYSDIAAPEILAKCTPRQRRLLGDLGPDALPCWHYYVDGECK
jgi:ectoine hydroxylase-related dioxygenase (phytanoyl-CoA dioxygenase family)